MNPVLEQLQSFSAAEEFLNYLGVDYEPSVVHVNRLHILKRFNQYLVRSPVTDELSESEALAACRSLLTQAYSDFVKSNAAQEKVFKVFQDQDGQSVSLQNVKMALRDRVGD